MNHQKRIEGIVKWTHHNTKVEHCVYTDNRETKTKTYRGKPVLITTVRQSMFEMICSINDPCPLTLEMAHARSSSPPENGQRPPVDQKLKSYPRSEKSSNHSSRGSQEPRGQSLGTQGGGHSRRNNSSPSRYDQDSCQEQWGKGGSEGSRNKSKSTWRPIREVLNVDTVLNELEQRRQQQHDSPRHSKPSSQERVHTEQGRDREREHVRTREDRKQKCLMTIYEDEQRHETESHSSVESESRANQQRGSRLKGGPKTLLRSDTWTIQRTESGYESSDRLSSGSTNPDSPGVDGFVVKDQRSTPEAQLQR